jgi:hypothetical protein
MTVDMNGPDRELAVEVAAGRTAGGRARVSGSLAADGRSNAAGAKAGVSKGIAGKAIADG